MTALIITGAVVLVGLLVVALLFGGRRRSPEEQEAEDVAQIEALWGAEEADAYRAHRLAERVRRVELALDAIEEASRREREA